MKLTETYRKRIKHLAGIRESKEIEDIDQKTNLDVYDFDGTLVDSPLPEDGKEIWKKKTGGDWVGGWFSEPDSLNLEVFDIPIISSVISDYKKSKANPQTLRIMLTGRIPALSKYVERVLSHYGLTFDDYLYNTGGETGDNKMNHIEMILRYNPGIRNLTMWDDRDEHIPRFQEWGDELVKKGYLDTFKINHIKGNRH